MSSAVRKMMISAILLASLSWASSVAVPVAVAAEEQQKNVEKAAYIPLGTESYLVGDYKFVTEGIVVGVGADEWTPFIPGGSIVGNSISALSNSPSLLLSNKSYPMNAQGQWQMMTAMSFAATLQSGVVTSPLGFDQDFFYGSGFVGGLNVVSGWVLGFSLTNSKIYAVYCRLPTSQNLLNDYFSSTYYVPLANRVTSGELDTLSMVIDSVEHFISYRVNGFELLRVSRPGLPIANKFRIADYGGALQEVTLPDSLQLAIGALVPPEPGIPFSACQQTAFNACTENIECAYKTLCQYAPIQQDGYVMELLSTYSFLTVIENSHVLSCYKPGKCPVLSECSCNEPSSCSSSSSSSSCSSSSSSSCPCSSSSSSSCPSSSSSSSCSSSSSSSSCSSSSSSSSCHVCPPPKPVCPKSSSSSSCPSSSSSSSCSTQICIPASSTSSSCSSHISEESPSECLRRRARLRRQGFIFPF